MVVVVSVFLCGSGCVCCRRVCVLVLCSCRCGGCCGCCLRVRVCVSVLVDVVVVACGLCVCVFVLVFVVVVAFLVVVSVSVCLFLLLWWLLWGPSFLSSLLHFLMLFPPSPRPPGQTAPMWRPKGSKGASGRTASPHASQSGPELPSGAPRASRAVSCDGTSTRPSGGFRRLVRVLSLHGFTWGS